ncbi:MAG: phosphoadenylyl-sulfate reductase [Chloroflexi bacterium]|nr:phosphoadenylyl-sulfate reductase [Chloroflexota bacterium]
MTLEEAEAVNQKFAQATPQEVLGWGLENFHPRISLASSFGAEDVVLIDMQWRISPDARVFSLDTLRLHTETYDVVDRVRQKYGIDVEILYPDIQAIDQMVKKHGYNCFYESVDFRKLCCGIRKVEPMTKLLRELDAWTSGVRRDQTATRTGVPKIEWDEVHNGMIKLNPLADWTSQQVWEYIRANDVPYNVLHDQGFPSIGCAPCTRAIGAGEDPRAGRWWWELDGYDKECGIHVGQDAAGNPIILRVGGQGPLPSGTPPGN